MEEVVSLVFHGCKLAKELEAILPNIANQPNILSRYCEEIVGIFSASRDRLNQLREVRSEQLEDVVGTAGVQDWWLRPTHTDLLRHTELLAADQHSGGAAASEQAAGGSQREAHAMEVADSGRGGSGSSSSSQRPRRRKNEANSRTIRGPVPLDGNTESPPEDGHTWRKYGQKEILGSKFPRAYFRCTHQKLYQCRAKKQVQRLDEDPHTYEVTYIGNHTCTLSSTAPTIPPAASMEPPMTTHQPPPQPPQLSTSVPLGHWLSIRPSGEGPSSSSNVSPFTDVQMYRNFGAIIGGGSSSSVAGSSGVGPSTAGLFDQYYHRQQPVVDWAEVMFNSGSSSNNSMDLIFSPMEYKWEAGGDQGDKKN